MQTNSQSLIERPHDIIKLNDYFKQDFVKKCKCIINREYCLFCYNDDIYNS